MINVNMYPFFAPVYDTYSTLGLQLASYECESPDSILEKELYKRLKYTKQSYLRLLNKFFC